MKSRTVKLKTRALKINAPAEPPRKFYSDIEIVRLAWLAIFVSVFSFIYYFRHEEILLYGDAVAHINIARRVFDSRTPGILQLGTVWLPLPHLLILPFIVSKQMWQTGSGGSMPSMAGFVLGVVGIFRLARLTFRSSDVSDLMNKVGPWAAALIFVANPNLIYMQATAMGESLYLALFIWSLVFFLEFIGGVAGALWKCGGCLVAACLTRYDGWFLACALVISAAVLFVGRQRQADARPESRALLHRNFLKFAFLAAAAPGVWLAYNAAVYRNPLEFANGPYSARAIERKTDTVNPAKGSLWAAGSYFVKAAELNVAGDGIWGGRLWLALAGLGSAVVWLERRGRLALLLWIPLLFYALSIAYGSVPIFIPQWWPFSTYNARYGLHLLPAFAVFVPAGVRFIVDKAGALPALAVSTSRWSNAITLLLLLIVAAGSYAEIWYRGPICFREADLNGRSRIALDRQLGQWLLSLPADSTLLMYLGEHVGTLERAGIPLQRTINEGNHRTWIQPDDAEGLWERALKDPKAYADYLVAFEGDPVWKAARDKDLNSMVAIHTTGQPAAIIFNGRDPSQRSSEGKR